MWTRFLFGWAVNALGIFVAAALTLVTYGDSVLALLAAALAFGVINVLIRPVVTILSLPAIVLTLGLFIFVVNALMLWLTDIVVGPFEVFGFWRTVGAAIVIGAINFVLHTFLKDITRDQYEEHHRQRES